MVDNRENRKKVRNRVKALRKRSSKVFEDGFLKKTTKICKNSLCKRRFETTQDYRFCDKCRRKMNRISVSNTNPLG